MSLRDAVDRIKRRIEEAILPEGEGPRLIMIRGGPPESCPVASVPGSDCQLEAQTGESEDAFTARALGWAAAIHAEWVVIGGLQPR